MSNNIEPTEEHYDASRAFVAKQIDDYYEVRHNDLARLLAEREAKLREELRGEWARLVEAREVTAMIVEGHQLRARVAELEGQVSESTRLRMTETLHGMGVEAMYQEREAQHLADIKALMGCCRGLVHDVDRLMCGIDVGRHAMVMRAALQRLAHYDDAKADAPAVDMQAWANGSCPEPGCSLANPHEQGVACVKPTAEGGEG